MITLLSLYAIVSYQTLLSVSSFDRFYPVFFVGLAFAYGIIRLVFIGWEPEQEKCP